MPKGPSIEQLLDEQRDELDRLCGDVSQGICSAERFDELEERASTIGMGLRNAFRTGERR